MPSIAVTAWHLADWTWESASTEDRKYILSRFNPPIVASGRSGVDFSRFQKALMNRFRELHVCRQLATGAKHKIVLHHPYPTAVAKEGWYREPLQFGGQFGSRFVEYFPQLSVSDGGTMRPALEIFDGALAAWDQLFREWGYFESRYAG
jgi:hypothetical protein